VLHASSQRRQLEHELRTKQQLIKDDWQRRKSEGGQTHDAVPPLQKFRALPAIKILEGMPVDDVKTQLEPNQAMSKVIKTNVESWDKKTRTALAKALEVAVPLVVSSTMLHPVDRVTGLFACKKCNRVDRKDQAAGSLNYQAVIKHKCPGKRAAKQKWDVQNFVRDDLAISTVRAALGACGMSEESATTAELDELGARFLCSTCATGMVRRLPLCGVDRSH